MQRVKTEQVSTNLPVLEEQPPATDAIAKLATSLQPIRPATGSNFSIVNGYPSQTPANEPLLPPSDKASPTLQAAHNDAEFENRSQFVGNQLMQAQNTNITMNWNGNNALSNAATASLAFSNALSGNKLSKAAASLPTLQKIAASILVRRCSAAVDRNGRELRKLAGVVQRYP